MKKHFGITFGVLLFAAVVAAGGYVPGFNDASVDSVMGEGFVESNRLVNDPTPWFAVRLDDGRQEQFDYTHDGGSTAIGVAYAFLAYEVPISLSLNYNSLDAGGKLTTAEVQQIISDFNAAGVGIEIVQHTDDNYASGDATTYEQLVDAIDPSELEAAFGMDVVTYAQPGDALDFMYENRASIMRIADSVGIKWADIGYGGQDYNPHANWGSHVSYDAQSNPPTGIGYSGALWPGVSENPLWMPPAATWDLGNKVVERPAVASGPYQYDGYTILADRTGNDPVNDWAKTVRSELMAKIANNWGQVIALHDSVAGAVDHVGEFSPLHLAKTLDALRDEGMLNLGTCSQVYEWANSRYAPGTDLVGNFNSTNPQFAIADTIGIEYGWIKGWGSPWSASATWVDIHGGLDIPNGINAKSTRGVGWPGDVTGAAVTGGFRGRPGGAKMTTEGNNLRFYRNQLPEGYYEFRLYNSHDQIQAKEMGTALVGKYAKTIHGMTNPAKAFGDTMMAMWFYDSNVTLQSGSPGDNTFTFRFKIDGREGVERIGDAGGQYPSQSMQSAYADPLWVRWFGGFWFDAGRLIDQVINIELIYLGPLD